jgi:K+ transport systems, NAD-binding component
MKKRSFCIIGLGRFGMTLTMTLAQMGHQVMVIDIDADTINTIADIVDNAVIGDATNETVLRNSGVKDYDVVVISLSEEMDDSILLTLMLKDLGAKYVIARANSDPHKRILEKIGADRVIFPEKDMGEKVAYMLGNSNVIEYIEFTSDYCIVEINVPHQWVGKNIIDLAVRRKYGVNIIAVTNHNDGKVHIAPSPQREFIEGDLVTLMGENEIINKVIAMLT